MWSGVHEDSGRVCGFNVNCVIIRLPAHGAWDSHSSWIDPFSAPGMRKQVLLGEEVEMQSRCPPKRQYTIGWRENRSGS